MGKFEIKDKIDSVIYKTYNTVSDLIFLSNFKARNFIKNNDKFKLTKNNSRCFIIGTGPSLNDLPEDFLRFISKEKSFGVNFLYKSKIFDIIKPNYYVLMDDLFWGKYKNTFSEIASKYENTEPIFITDYRARSLLNKEALYLYAKNYPIEQVRINLCENSSALMNVVSYAIAAAIFIGFKDIYLLGCDYNAFCNEGLGHCYDDEELTDSGLNLAYFLKFYHLTTEFHYLLSRESKKKGVNIINLTNGSLLDAYTRASYTDIEW